MLRPHIHISQYPVCRCVRRHSGFPAIFAWIHLSERLEEFLQLTFTRPVMNADGRCRFLSSRTPGAAEATVSARPASCTPPPKRQQQERHLDLELEWPCSAAGLFPLPIIFLIYQSHVQHTPLMCSGPEAKASLLIWKQTQSISASPLRSKPTK